jgi:hypothetical protein
MEAEGDRLVHAGGIDREVGKVGSFPCLPQTLTAMIEVAHALD